MSEQATRHDFRQGANNRALVVENGVTINRDPNKVASGQQMERKSRVNSAGEIEFSIGSVVDKGSPLEAFARSINHPGVDQIFGSVVPEIVEAAKPPTASTAPAPVVVAEPEEPLTDENAADFCMRMAQRLAGTGSSEGVVRTAEVPRRKFGAIPDELSGPELRLVTAAIAPPKDKILARFCPNCAKPFEGEQKYCPECGTRRQEYAPNLS